MTSTTTATTRATTTVLRAEGVSRVYGSGAGEVRALEDVSVEVGAGELVVVVGPSGSDCWVVLDYEISSRLRQLPLSL